MKIYSYKEARKKREKVVQKNKSMREPKVNQAECHKGEEETGDEEKSREK